MSLAKYMIFQILANAAQIISNLDRLFRLIKN